MVDVNRLSSGQVYYRPREGTKGYQNVKVLHVDIAKKLVMCGLWELGRWNLFTATFDEITRSWITLGEYKGCLRK